MSEIPVVELTAESTARGKRMSGETYHPWLVYTVDDDDNENMLEQSFVTRAEAVQYAKILQKDGELGVRIVHITLPPMPY